MKKAVIVITSIALILVMIFSLSSCLTMLSELLSDETSSSSSSSSSNSSSSSSSSSSSKNEKTMTADEFENLLKDLPLTVSYTNYYVQSDDYKALYPDMLQAVLKNNTKSDIKNAVIAFVAWDVNNLPVKIKGNIDFSNGSYVVQAKFSDMNLIPGETTGDKNGYSLDQTCKIDKFKAIVVSFETFEGKSWHNPYFDEWKKLYEGVKYSNNLNVSVTVEDSSFKD